MDASPRKGIIAGLRELRGVAGVWMSSRLTPEECAEAAALDRRITSNPWRWLGQFALVVLVLGLIAFAIWPQLGLGPAIFYAAVACAYVLAALSTAWYGWRKYTRHRPWKVILAFALLLIAGGAVGYVVGNLHHGRALTDIDAVRGARALGISLALGLVLAVTLVGVAHLRLRETTLRAAQLQAEADRERLARQGAQAELKLLQAQVEPHFLFNTLANVRHLVQSGSPDALVMLDHLIHYLRTSLPEIRSDSSTLGREAELARAYLEIMRLRMGGALEVEVNVPRELSQMPFPPLMVMTLVENAIKHGVAPNGRGRIAVRAGQSDGRLRVEVEDDGQGIGGQIGQGLGLQNIRERLRAIYGEAARLDLSARQPEGARASIEVPA